MIITQKVARARGHVVHPTKTPGNSRCVLLAEDDAALRRYIEVLLERAGYEVVSAADGLEAMKALLTVTVDVMVTDADDCVSNRLAAHVSSNPHSFGWCFDEGWLHDERSRLIYRRRHGFDDICGTSSIVRMDESDLPGSESDEKSDNIILRSGHTTIRRNMVERGTPLEILPFAGAVYNLATGENWSPFSLRRWKSKKVLVKKLLGYRLLTRGIRTEFGLVDLEKE